MIDNASVIVRTKYFVCQVTPTRREPADWLMLPKITTN